MAIPATKLLGLGKKLAHYRITCEIGVHFVANRAEIDVDLLHQPLVSLHVDRPQPTDIQVIDGRQEMAVGPIPRPAVYAFGFPAAC
jgi:hypothetical protein